MNQCDFISFNECDDISFDKCDVISFHVPTSDVLYDKSLYDVDVDKSGRKSYFYLTYHGQQGASVEFTIPGICTFDKFTAF